MTANDVPWRPFQDGKTLGTTGSEGGVILREEEHADGARICLERGGRHPYSITCGVYGTLVHTRFFRSESEAVANYESMKPGLAEILAALPLASDPSPNFRPSEEAVKRFLQSFP